MEHRALLTCATLLGLVLLPLPVAAQVRDQNGRYTSQFLPAGRELKQRLAGVSEAVKEQRYAEAAGAVGEFFLDEELEDYFVDPSGKTSLKGEAQKLLLDLPRAGRESYELQFGADARTLLATAIEQHDDAKLVEVMRKYFHTKSGYEAAVLWSRKQLDAGRPLPAAVMLQRVAQTSLYAKDYEPELSLLTAISWRLAGHDQEAQQALLALKTKHPQALTIAGEQRPWFTSEAQAIAWLDEIVGEQHMATNNEVAEWRMHRGNVSRTAETIGSPPVPTMRWHKFLGRDEVDDLTLARKAKEFRSSGIAAIPTVSPLVVNNLVLMRTPERLMAVDIETGKFVWRYPWADDLVNDSRTSGRGPSADQQHDRELALRVWEDRAYGQLSSDGESVFLLDELGYPGGGYNPSMLIQPGGLRQPNPGQPTSQNKLVALSLAKQGKLRWTVGGESGEDEPRLAGAFFLGVPIVHDGNLYGMIELNGELRLVVLDPDSGKLQWSQQLAHIESVPQQILGDSTRRLSGATPSLASGILICPTSACSVVAIDLAQRKLLWGYQYEPAATIKQQSAWIGYVQPSRPVGSYWLDSTVAIAEGKVILTPTDSDNLICLDLVTGKEAWKPQRRHESLADMLYVAAVHEGKIVLVGRTRVTALKLADGQPAWDSTLELSAEMPSGRGFQNGHNYYLPTSQSQLIEFDLRNGKVIQRTPTGRVLGNLVPYGSQLVSQQFDGVTTYYQSESLRTLLADRLKAAPLDPLALAQQAQLQLFDGKRDAALETLRKAYNLDQSNDDTRALLVRTLLEALERDFTSYQQLAAEIEPLLDQPQHKRDFLRLRAQGLQKTGDAVAAFNAYTNLARHEIAERPELATAPAMLAFDPLVRIRFDRWVQTRMQELYLAASTNDQAKMDAAIAQQLTDLPPPTTDSLLRIVQYFGWHASAADSARTELAALRLDSGDMLGAETLLTKFASNNSNGRAVALLAAIYEKAGRLEYAADSYLRLRDRFSELPVRGKQTGRELFEAATKSPTLGPRLIQGGWPGGHVVMSEGGDLVAGNVGYGAVQRLYPMQIAELRGALDDGSALVFDSRQRQLILRDRLGGEWNQVTLQRPDGRLTTTTQPAITHAHLLGHLAVVSVGQDLMAYNLLDRGQDSMEAQLWRHDLLPNSTNSGGGIVQVRAQAVPYPWAWPARHFATIQPDSMVGSVAALGDRAVCFTRGRDVICVDPLNGETLWERTMIEPGSELFGDDELLFVVPPRKEEAFVLSVADGRELGKRKVGAIDFRWSTLGRNVLVCKQDGREFAARLYDAFSEKTLWEGRFTFGSRGTLIGRDEMAMMQPDGKLVIVSLADGQVKLNTTLQPEPKLMYLHVLRSKSQYLMQMETIGDKGDVLPRVTVQPVPGGDTSRLVTGRLYAFDRATMKPAWQSPAYISQYGLPLDQPTELPIIVFLRQLVPTADAPSRETRSGVLVLDRRDGRMLLERDNIRIQQTNVYHLVAKPAESFIELTLTTGRGSASGKVFTFKLTDDPTPPAPPAQTGAMSSQVAEGKSGNFFQAIGRALGEGTRPETPDDFVPRPPNPLAPLPPGFPPGFPPGLVPRPR